MSTIRIPRFLVAGALLAVGSILSCSARAAQVGLWQFNNNFTNAVSGGTAVSVLGGWAPAYSSQTIAGSPATVLSFPAFQFEEALDMPNDAAPNGVGLGVNDNWSVVMDVKFPSLEGLDGFISLFETSTLGSGDGDYFLNGGSLGIASQYGGLVNENTWTRIAVTVDTVSTPDTYTINGYIDGVLAATATTGAAPGGRHALKSALNLFADNDNETGAGLINSFAYYDQSLAPASIQTLGGPTAAGIPTAASQVGRWNFDNNLNNAIGGAAAMSATGVWTPTYVNETIGGSPATVLSFPAFDDTQALTMPNEAMAETFLQATTTNSWSVVMDVKFPVLTSFTSIWDTDSPLDPDGEYFIQVDDEGDGTTGGIGIDGQYNGVFTADKWTRLAVTVDGSAPGEEYVVTGYIDGVLAGSSTVSSSPNGRESIADILHLFGDDGGETADGSINSLAFYDAVLTPAAIAALGAASAAGIPLAPTIDANFDNNAFIDGGDLLLWQRNAGLNSGALNTQGDANGDGKVNAADLQEWKNHFGAPAAAIAGAVPEPAGATLALLLVGGMAMKRRKR